MQFILHISVCGGKGRNSTVYFIVITLTVPRPDANLDYSIPGRCSARDRNVPRRRCPAPGMGSSGSPDRSSGIRYVPDGPHQLQDMSAIRESHYKNNINFIDFCFKHARAIFISSTTCVTYVGAMCNII